MLTYLSVEYLYFSNNSVDILNNFLALKLVCWRCRANHMIDAYHAEQSRKSLPILRVRSFEV
jgi:hypothetical protein